MVFGTSTFGGFRGMGFLTCAWTGFLIFTRPVYARPPGSPSDDSARPRGAGGDLGPVAAQGELFHK